MIAYRRSRLVHPQSRARRVLFEPGGRLGPRPQPPNIRVNPKLISFNYAFFAVFLSFRSRASGACSLHPPGRTLDLIIIIIT